MEQIQLIKSSTLGSTCRGCYDDNVNQLTETNSQSVITHVCDEQNRLLSAAETLADGSVETTYYYYDNNGNLVSKHVETIEDYESGSTGSVELAQSGDGEFSYGIYKYDVFNQLIYAETEESTSVYTYNGEGLRISKTVI